MDKISNSIFEPGDAIVITAGYYDIYCSQVEVLKLFDIKEQYRIYKRRAIIPKAYEFAAWLVEKKLVRLIKYKQINVDEL